MAEQIVTEKVCTKCKQVKPVSEFHRTRNAKCGYRNQCKQCRSQSGLGKYQTDLYELGCRLWRMFGMTIEDYNRRFEGQNGACAICKAFPTTRRLSVDHCHTTGRVRGLLCDKCNAGLGHFLDSPELLIEAAIYLQNVTGPPQPTRWNGRGIVPPHKRTERGESHYSVRVGSSLIGEKHGMALFTDDQIKEFRRRYDSGEATSTAMAKEVGVHKSTMQAITSRRHWKHIR